MTVRRIKTIIIFLLYNNNKCYIILCTTVVVGRGENVIIYADRRRRRRRRRRRHRSTVRPVTRRVSSHYCPPYMRPTKTCTHGNAPNATQPPPARSSTPPRVRHRRSLRVSRRPTYGRIAAAVVVAAPPRCHRCSRLHCWCC